MVRRKRQRFSNPRSRQRESGSPAPDASVVEAGSAETSYDVPVLFNTTFSTHRISPLHLGSRSLDDDRLATLAHRLRDTLVGDVVRGVEVGLGGEDSAMGRAGSLEQVRMGWVEVGDLLGGPPESRGRPASRDLSSDAVESMRNGGFGSGFSEWSDGELQTAARSKALHIALEYENTSGMALLLPSIASGRRRGAEGGDDDDNDGGDDDDLMQSGNVWSSWGQPRRDTKTSTDAADLAHFLHLPLLFLRMPAPLKPVIIDFLSSTFDCRVSSLLLGTKSLVRAWEGWLQDAGPPTRGPLVKDVVMSLGFHLPSATDHNYEIKDHDDKSPPELSSPQGPGLKSIDVIIPHGELRRFVKAGRLLEQERSSSYARKEISRGKRKASHDWEFDDLSRRKRQQLAGRCGDEGWGWRQPVDASSKDTTIDQPFMTALGRYMNHHLGLNMFHPGARITRIACGGFVISEGRVKIFSPPGRSADEVGQMTAAERTATWTLMKDLADRAGGQRLATRRLSSM